MVKKHIIAFMDELNNNQNELKFTIQGPHYGREWKQSDGDEPTGPVKNKWYEIYYHHHSGSTFPLATIYCDPEDNVTKIIYRAGTPWATVNLDKVARVYI